MNLYFRRLIRLFLGIFLYALGIVVTLQAKIGYAPWDVFHDGISKTTGISFGTASIIVGLVIIIIAVLLGEKLGIGTITNIILIGLIIDILLAIGFIPAAPNFILGILMLISGLFVIAFATFFYMGSAFGSGPRDSLMVALTRITRLPPGVCRSTIELIALCAGWLLGGEVGIGTVISAVAIGFCIQITFTLLKFRPTDVKHEQLNETYIKIHKRLVLERKI